MRDNNAVSTPRIASATIRTNRFDTPSRAKVFLRKSRKRLKRPDPIANLPDRGAGPVEEGNGLVSLSSLAPSARSDVSGRFR